MNRLRKVAFWASLTAFVLIWSYCWTQIGRSQAPPSMPCRFPAQTKWFVVLNGAKAVVLNVYADEVVQSQGYAPKDFMFYRHGEEIAFLRSGQGLTVKDMSK